MSDAADSDDPVTISVDGVRVEKRFVADEFPVPAVKFDLRTETEEPVRVKLVDRIPEWFQMEGVGFHPEFESENWTAYKDHRVEFVRTIDPGEHVETVYGIRVDASDDVSDFLAEPTIEELAIEDSGEPESAADVVGEDKSRAVREVLAGERDTLPGLESFGRGSGGARDLVGAAAGDPEGAPADRDPANGEPASAETETEPEADAPEASHGAAGDTTEQATDQPAAADEPAEPTAPESTAGAESGAADTDEDVAVDEEPLAANATDDGANDTEATAMDTDQDHEEGEAAESYVDVEGQVDEPEAKPTPAVGDLAAALAEEIREGTVADDDLETLRDELGAGVPRSVDVRIRRLQSQTEDLAAYRDALEEFIDEHGTGAEVIEGIEGRLDDLGDELADLEATVNAGDKERAGLRSDLRALENEVADLETVTEDLDALSGRVDDVDDDLESLRADVEGTTDRVDDHGERLDRVDDRVEDVDGDLGAVDERVDAVDDELGAVREDVGAVDDELGAVREEVGAVEEDLSTTREQLESDLSALEADIESLRGTVEDLEDLRGTEGEVADLKDQVAELEEFRDRLRSTFGSPGGPGGNADE